MFLNCMEQTKKVTIGREPVPAMGIDHTLLYLCCHGAKHAWYRLFWLCDVARLLHKARQTIDWTRLLATAVNLGIQRVLAQGIILSNLLLGGPVPEPVQNLCGT